MVVKVLFQSKLVFKGQSESWCVQGSTLSTLLFVIVMYVLTQDVTDGLLIEWLHADNLGLSGESLGEIMGK